MRTEWRERAPREGWEIRYTPIGGRVSFDPSTFLGPDAGVRVRRALSQAMCALTNDESAGSNDAKYLASVVTKIVQRGTAPRIFHADTSKIDVEGADFEDLVAAVVGRVDPDWTLDPSVALDPTWEAPFWRMFVDRAPAICRWIIPQAWFEGLVGSDTDGERWVDFLVHFPWTSPGVIEIDGSGHSRQRLLDEYRNRLLERNQFKVARLPGSDALDPSGDTVSQLLKQSDHVALRGVDEKLLRAVHGPAAIHRFMYALACGLEKGALTKGRDWVIELIDQTGVVTDHANIALDLLAAVDDVWGLGLVPSNVVVGGVHWTREADGRFVRRETQESDEPNPMLSVRLEPFIPAHAALPNTSAIPQVVIRGCLLPVDLQWTFPTSVERRDRTSDDKSRAALDRLVADLFGFDSFREGQREAISRLLSGGDSLVLLPTGAGKTLIYQLAGLLRPGVTMVISPLKALIDDQERRLNDMGTDRVVGFHSGRQLAKRERQQLQESIGRGEALVVIVAPERLQIAEFRTQAGSAASEFLVNLVVVDEAHCVSEWGHQFRTSYLRLGRNLRRICAGDDDVPPPLLALTATASPRVLSDMKLELDLDENDPGLMFRPASFNRPNLNFHVFRTSPSARTSTLREALDKVSAELGVSPGRLGEVNGPDTMSGIVFVPHGSSGLKLGVTHFRGEISQALEVDDEKIAVYAGAKPKEIVSRNDWEIEKVAYAEDFRTNVRPIMVSTSAFGMGIDKPNIRYTIHVSLPGSIEGFAQESGRAGRDGLPSHCVLLAPTDVDGGLRSIEDRKKIDTKFSEDDVKVQLALLRQSFESPEIELEATLAVLEDLLRSAGGGLEGGMSVVVPFGGETEDDGRRGESAKQQRERALFRLLNMGVVDDYTIEYGSRSFTVFFGYFTPSSIVETTRLFLDRVTGGNREVSSRVADVAPGESAVEVAQRLAKNVIDTIYDRIEPARALALREMLVLSSLSTSSDISSRINAYLSDGQVAMILDRLVRRETTISECLEGLSDLAPDEFEWVGAATRFLESYPDHPILLAVRALGEAWQLEASRSEFLRYLGLFMVAVSQFGLEEEEVHDVVTWVLRLLRQYFGGRRSDWCVEVWKVLEDSGTDDDLFRRIEAESLLEIGRNRIHASEIDVILSRQVRRVTARVRTFAESQ